MIFYFKAVENADKVIKNWYEKSGFREAVLPDHPRYDDISYCFSLDDNVCKTFLTISILDDTVHIETWAVQNANNNKLAMEQIKYLLEAIKRKAYEGIFE